MSARITRLTFDVCSLAIITHYKQPMIVYVTLEFHATEFDIIRLLKQIETHRIG